MADIVRQSVVCDGYDVQIITGGQTHVIHFLSQPSPDQLSAAIQEFEEHLVAKVVEELGLDQFIVEDDDSGL